MKEDAGYNFLNVTKYPTDQQPDATLGIPAPEFVISPRNSAEIISLPHPADTLLPPLDLRDAIASRRTIRSFTHDPIPLAALSYLLWACSGITGNNPMYRAAPSAGALHPIDTYLAVQQIEGLATGVWRYHPGQHALELTAAGTAPVAALGRACMMQPAVLRAPVVFLWVATPYRTVWKYGLRGYRDIFLDAGHICQNCYLAAEQCGLGLCAIGAFYDNEAAAALNLSADQHLLYAAACGVPREDSA
ncbi:MAG: SagB/ThcOx family dehydrogenase [Methanocorpusculum sp.]|nr:SagB/ThcOx family dehydrogenase [Methanocorpusculum sp.]